MSQQVCPLSDLKPSVKRWVIKVRVATKGALRAYQTSGSGMVFTVKLIDKEGTEIEATMFGNAAMKFYSIFQPGKVYLISKGSLSPANPAFSTSAHPWQIKLQQKSQVEEVQDDSFIDNKYNIVQISDLSLFNNKLFDVLGVVFKVEPAVRTKRKLDNGKQDTRRELTLVDQSQKTVSVCLWNELATIDGARLEELDKPLVLITALRTNDFQGLSLATSLSSMLWINPEIPEAIELREWYDTFGRGAPIGVTTVGLSSATQDTREMISSILLPSVGKEETAFFTIRGCISYIKPDQQMWFRACHACNRKLVEEHTRFWCKEHEYVQSFRLRYLLHAKIMDSSGDTWVSAFNEATEKILGVPADENMRNREDDANLYHKCLSDATWVHKVFYVSVYYEEYHDEERQRVMIRGVRDVDWSAESKLLLAEIAKL